MAYRVCYRKAVQEELDADGLAIEATPEEECEVYPNEFPAVNTAVARAQKLLVEGRRDLIIRDTETNEVVLKGDKLIELIVRLILGAPPPAKR